MDADDAAFRCLLRFRLRFSEAVGYWRRLVESLLLAAALLLFALMILMSLMSFLSPLIFFFLILPFHEYTCLIVTPLRYFMLFAITIFR